MIFVVPGQSLTEIWLPDETTTHLSNPLIPKTISVPKFFFDTQEICQVIFPNGVVYETFPINNLQHEFVESAISAVPGCGVGFRDAPPSMSGTYELISRVYHILDNTRSLTRQKFHLTFITSDTWQ